MFNSYKLKETYKKKQFKFCLLNKGLELLGSMKQIKQMVEFCPYNWWCVRILFLIFKKICLTFWQIMTKSEARLFKKNFHNRFSLQHLSPLSPLVNKNGFFQPNSFFDLSITSTFTFYFISFSSSSFILMIFSFSYVCWISFFFPNFNDFYLIFSYVCWISFGRRLKFNQSWYYSDYRGYHLHKGFQERNKLYIIWSYIN